MHEFHLMTQVVKAVEEKLHGTEDAKLSVVRLKISALSHLLTHDQVTLQTTFRLAAHGTRADGATLEIIAVPCEAWCPQCHRDTAVTGPEALCSACGGPMVAGPAGPEVVLHELVVQE
jgi:hydrogenase nickel incorporation protein HypA/HybF